MADFHVNIYEGEAFEGRVTLRETQPGIYKLDHPLADPERYFLHEKGDDVNEMIMYALMHINNRKNVK